MFSIYSHTVWRHSHIYSYVSGWGETDSLLQNSPLIPILLHPRNWNLHPLNWSRLKTRSYLWFLSFLLYLRLIHIQSPAALPPKHITKFAQVVYLHCFCTLNLIIPHLVDYSNLWTILLAPTLNPVKSAPHMSARMFFLSFWNIYQSMSLETLWCLPLIFWIKYLLLTISLCDVTPYFSLFLFYNSSLNSYSFSYLGLIPRPYKFVPTLEHWYLLFPLPEILCHLTMQDCLLAIKFLAPKLPLQWGFSWASNLN